MEQVFYLSCGTTQGLCGNAVSPTLPHLELILKSEGHGRAAHFRATAKTWVFSGITSMKFNVEMRAHQIILLRKESLGRLLLTPGHHKSVCSLLNGCSKSA